MIFVRPKERCSPDKWSLWFTRMEAPCPGRLGDSSLTERKGTPVLMTCLMYSKGSKVKLKKKRQREILPHFAFSTYRCLFVPLQRG